MDKVFNVEIDGQITLPDGRKLGPFEETTVNVVQPSECPSDPIVENAKQTGGFGYTEQGEQTVITWDGNPDGLPDAFGAKMYKVSDKTPTKEELALGRFIHNEEEYEINEETDITVGVNCLMVHYSENETAYRIFVAYENGVVFGDETIEEAGTYFANSRSTGTVTSLTYGTPDTVHKIDEKYLPSGMMIVNGHWDEMDPLTLTLDKTVDEILAVAPNVAIFCDDTNVIIPMTNYDEQSGVCIFSLTIPQLDYNNYGGVSDGYACYSVIVTYGEDVVYNYNTKEFV